MKKGENNYNLVDSEEYIKLGDYIYQVTYSEKTEITEGIEEKTVSVVNTLQRGSIEITKNNANKEKLGGAEFKITGLGNYEQTVTTPSGGENKGVTLTNTIKEEESESSSEEETTSTEKEKEKHTPNTTSRTSTGGKTGDTTPIKTWIIIGVVAAAVIIFLIIRKKKSE